MGREKKNIGACWAFPFMKKGCPHLACRSEHWFGGRGGQVSWGSRGPHHVHPCDPLCRNWWHELRWLLCPAGPRPRLGRCQHTNARRHNGQHRGYRWNSGIGEGLRAGSLGCIMVNIRDAQAVLRLWLPPVPPGSIPSPPWHEAPRAPFTLRWAGQPTNRSPCFFVLPHHYVALQN